MLTTDEPPDAHDRYGRELNATKHGILSRHAVLPWEDRAEFDALLATLVHEHVPEGPTERHLVEEIAVIMWRKQRVLLAEAACQRAELHRRLEWDRRDLARRAVVPRGGGLFGEDPKASVAVRPGDLEAEMQGLMADEAAAGAAINALRAGGSHDEAVAVLSDNLRGSWDEALFDSAMMSALAEEQGIDVEEDADCRRADRDGLLRFLEDDVRAWLRARRRELEDRLQVRSQALGEAVDLERLEKVARYETHLDRKLGRSLPMLLKLQEVRRTIAAPAA